MHSDSVRDETLLERCARGDEGAFRLLYERHNRMVYNLAFRMLGNHADAEEIMPEVFVKAWTRARDFRGHSRVTTWLYRIAANMAMDRLRSARAGKEVFWEDLPPQDRDIPAGELDQGNPERAALLEADRRTLAGAMARLGPEDRLLVTLYHLQDCSYAEIEEITGIAPHNIKSKLFRARRRLRDLMGVYEKGDAPDDMRRRSAPPDGLRMAAAVRT